MTRVKILLLDDSQVDADLLRKRLTEDHVDFDMKRVDTPASFSSALATGGFDLILVDESSTAFEGDAAIEAARESAPDVPIIIVSQGLDFQVAINLLKRSATDCVHKGRLDRLAPAIDSALAEARGRADRKRAEEDRREAGRLKQESLATLAHDLRNPLAAISNAMHLARMSSEEEHQAWARDMIEQQVKHLARLIDDLDKMSRNRGDKS